MTTTTLVRRIWSTRRGIGLLIAAMMLATMALLYMILDNVSRRPEVVRYGSVVIAPDQPAYCPGETMTYPVRVSVLEGDLPVVLHVVEAWYREADGITLQTTARVYELPILRPVSVQATARRIVPDVAPGVYWLDHMSQNGKIETYTVGPVEIRPCP